MIAKRQVVNSRTAKTILRTKTRPKNTNGNGNGKRNANGNGVSKHHFRRMRANAIKRADKERSGEEPHCEKQRTDAERSHTIQQSDPCSFLPADDPAIVSCSFLPADRHGIEENPFKSFIGQRQRGIMEKGSCRIKILDKDAESMVRGFFSLRIYLI